MIIGVLRVEIEIPHADNLKAKRAVLNRVKDRVRNKFNVSIAEVEANEVWNYAELGIACVANDQRHANQVLSKIAEFVETLHDYVLVDVHMEFLNL